MNLTVQLQMRFTDAFRKRQEALAESAVMRLKFCKTIAAAAEAAGDIAGKHKTIVEQF